jgi:hypothetical protein
VQYAVDGGAYSTARSISLSGSIRGYDKYSIEPQGNYMAIKYSNSNASEPFKIYNWMVDYKLHKLR